MDIYVLLVIGICILLNIMLLEILDEIAEIYSINYPLLHKCPK